MRRQLLDLFQAFTFGIICVSIFVVSIWFAKAPETDQKLTSELSFEKVSKSIGTAYVDWAIIFVSGSSTLSLFPQEKNNNQIAECSSIFDYVSFNQYQSFFRFEIREGLKYTNILDQLHNNFFFF